MVDLIYCRIVISANSQIAKENYAKPYQRDNQIVDLPDYWIMRNGRKVKMSEMRIGETIVFTPLFSKDGHKQIRMTLKQFNWMVKNAPVVSDDIFPVSPKVLAAVEKFAREERMYS